MRGPTRRTQVLRRYPKAVCYMSQISGMFFVKHFGRKSGRFLAYEQSANLAWKMANIAPMKNA